MSDLEKELNILLRIQDHPNIVKLIGFCQYDVCHVLVMEYLNGKNLAVLLEDQLETQLNEWIHRVDIAHQFANGLSHLHKGEKPIIHMDLKPGNVLVVKQWPKYYCKARCLYRYFLSTRNASFNIPLQIADYGLSKTTDISGRMGKRSPREGTVGYVAPERYKSEYSVKVDVFR